MAVAAESAARALAERGVNGTSFQIGSKIA
jgi:hypothetical protein